MSIAPLKICLDARLDDGVSGGVQQVVIGLANGLARLDPGPEEYHFLVQGRAPDWLRPHLHGSFRTLESRPQVGPPRPRPAWKRAVETVVPARLIAYAGELLGPQEVPESDGTIERAKIDVMHQTLQLGFRTRVPCIYMPYDLQHLHLPENFGRNLHRLRALHYPVLCGQAVKVASISRWTTQDLVKSLGLSPKKVVTIWNAPAIDAYPIPSEEDVARVRAFHGIPETFALYPAQTWPHKNHLRMLDALALLRDRDGLRVSMVFTGSKSEHFPLVERHARRRGLSDQVRFLGFIPPLELQALYRLARMMVFPSRFEGFGMPVVEAFRVGLPVACSNVTSLPEVAGNAALLFDPDDTGAIADATRRLWLDEGIRSDLRSRGRERSTRFSWERTAYRYRALYRLVAGRQLSGEEQAALHSDGEEAEEDR